jgi:hypothetical protein
MLCCHLQISDADTAILGDQSKTLDQTRETMLWHHIMVWDHCFPLV